MTRRPAGVLGLPAGTLLPGAAADICLFDPDEEWTYDAKAGQSKSSNSPWSGRTLQGPRQDDDRRRPGRLPVRGIVSQADEISPAALAILAIELISGAWLCWRLLKARAARRAPPGCASGRSRRSTSRASSPSRSSAPRP
jgi:hypothetical protein